MKVKRMRLWLLVCLTLALLSGGRAGAQSDDQEEPAVSVTHQVETPRVQGLELQVFFSVREGKRPLPGNTIKDAWLTLLGEQGRNKPQLSSADQPIKIALVLDESGSIADSRWTDTVRQAVLQAIDQAPANAEIAIFTFSDTPDPVNFGPKVPFSSRADARRLMQEPGTYNPQTGNVTCLYDATYRTLDYLERTLRPGDRRAMIVFSDGIDERSSGQPCSTMLLSDVVQRARPDPPTGFFVPIYTLGLCRGANNCGNLRPADGQNPLDTIATSTGGLFFAEASARLAESFSQVMGDLKSQVYVTDTVLPCTDTKAVLNVMLANTTEPIETVISFQPLPAAACYTPRAGAVLLPPKPAQLTSGEQVYTTSAQVDNSSPLAISALEYRVIGPGGEVLGDTIEETILPGSTGSVELTFPRVAFRQAGAYTTVIAAKSANGAYVRPLDQAAIDKQCELPPDTRFALACAPWTVELLDQASVRIIGQEQSEADPAVFQLYLEVSNRESLITVWDSIRFELEVSDANRCKLRDRGGLLDAERRFLSSEERIPIAVRLDQPPTAPLSCEVSVRLIPPAPGGDRVERPTVSSAEPFVVELLPPSFWRQHGATVGWAAGAAGLLIGLFVLRMYLPRRRRQLPQPYNPQGQTEIAPQAAAAVPPRAAGVAPATAPATKRRLLVRVVKTSDPTFRHEQFYADFPLVIGREEGGLVIPGDRKLSRRHVEIRLEGTGFVIFDLSRYGTKVNDRSIKGAEPTPISGSTLVKLSENTTIEVRPEL